MDKKSLFKFQTHIQPKNNSSDKLQKDFSTIISGLDKIACLFSLSIKEKFDIARAMHLQSFKKGYVLFEKSVSCNILFIIQSGIVEELEYDNGIKSLSRLKFKGDTSNVLSFFAPKERPKYSAICIDYCTIWTISHDKLFAIICMTQSCCPKPVKAKTSRSSFIIDKNDSINSDNVNETSSSKNENNEILDTFSLSIRLQQSFSNKKCWMSDCSQVTLIQSGLEDSPIFKDVSTNDIIRIAKSVIILEFNEGDTIVDLNQNFSSKCFYIIETGEVDYFENEKYVKHLYPQNYFGHEVFLGNHNPYFVIAKTYVRVIVFDENLFIYALQPLHQLIYENETVQNSNQDLLLLMNRFEKRNSSVLLPDDIYDNEQKRLNNIIENLKSYNVTIIFPDGTEQISTTYFLNPSDIYEINFEDEKYVDYPIHVQVFNTIIESEKHSLYSVCIIDPITKVNKSCLLDVICKKGPEEFSNSLFQTLCFSRNLISNFLVRTYACFQNKNYIFVLHQNIDFNVQKYLEKIRDELRSEELSIKDNYSKKTCSLGLLCFNHSNEKLSIVHQKIFDDYIVFIIACLITSLENLHLKGIIYRNLKPENVFINESGYACLSNFCFLKFTKEYTSGTTSLHVKELQRAYTICGSPGFMAPEIIQANGYDYKIDFWALGCTIFYFYTGTNPFNFPETHNYMEIIKRSCEVMYKIKFPTDMSPQIKDFVSQLLCVDHEKRLGCRKDTISDNYEEIKAHPCLKSINWTCLSAQNYDVLIKPDLCERDDFESI